MQHIFLSTYHVAVIALNVGDVIENESHVLCWALCMGLFSPVHSRNTFSLNAVKA